MNAVIMNPKTWALEDDIKLECRFAAIGSNNEMHITGSRIVSNYDKSITRLEALGALVDRNGMSVRVPINEVYLYD